MEEKEEETERNINNITCDTSFQSPIDINAQKKDAIFLLERQLSSGVLVEMVEKFRGCTIQSTISDSAHSDSDKQGDEINDSEEQVDVRNRLRNNYAEQVDPINDSEK